MSKKIVIPLIILVLLVIAGGVFWWWQRGRKVEELPTELPGGIEYATPETGIIEGVVKPAPFSPEDIIVDPETGTKIIKDEIGILFKDDVLEEERNEIIASINGEIVGYGLSGQSVEVKIKGNPSISDLKRIVEDLKKSPKVEYAILSRVGTIIPQRVPDPGKDPQWKDSWNEDNPSGKNWGLEAIYAPSAWNYNDLIKPVKIGVFDIGFVINHEDLRVPEANTNLASQRINEIISKIAFLEKRKECVLEEGEVINHGTHVAGIIGALSNNEVGITGMVWNRDLSIYEVNLKEIDIEKGIEWLLNRDSKIINLSWGFTPKCSSKKEIEDAQRYYNKILKEWVEKYNNFLIIQSAGNSDIDAEREVIFNPQLDKPKYEELKRIVITVGAIELNPGKIKSFFTGDWDKTFFAKGKGQYILASFSNSGDLIDVVAPGVNIYSTLRDESKLKNLSGLSCFDFFNNSYGCKSGTSMAAPFVTGAAGLIWGVDPDLTAEQVKEIIVNSADRPITYEGREYKILNAKSSVKIAYELVGEAITGPQEPLPGEEVIREIPEIIEKSGPAALVPPSAIEEKPEEKKKIEETSRKITALVRDQHGESVKNADFWLIDIKGKKYGNGETSLTGYLEIDTKSIPEGDYTLHIEKVTWDGLTKIPYCDPYEKKISITKEDISLGTILVRKWSKITAKLVDETGSLVPDNPGFNAFAVIDKDGSYSDFSHTYPNPPYHWRYQNRDGWIESYPLPDGEYTLRIRIYWSWDIWEKTIVERKVNISGSDVYLGEILIPKK